MKEEVKLFTPKEAAQTLPLVRQIVEDILSTSEQLRVLSSKVKKGAEKDPEVVKGMERLNQLFEELEDLGCYYKDWNFTMGLVDFPARLGGEEVFLCWRSDESEIRFYHEVDSGYSGRKKIPAEFL